MRRYIYTLLFVAVLFSACTGSGGSLGTFGLDMSGTPETIFTINDPSQLIGGPMATGRVGDVLLQNDKIRLIIEQPGKDAWVGNFGGSIIDADLVRNGSAGQDNFAFIQPLINIEWTVNVFDFEVIEGGEGSGRTVFRTYGMIDVYDYLDIDFISPVAKAMTGQSLYFAPRFDDVNNPFALTELSNLDTVVTTDYTLEPGKNYVKIDTTFRNNGGEEVYLPVGDFINGGGEVMFLIPGLGFTPELMPQIQGDTPALIYVGFEGNDISYGYFYDMGQFVAENDEGVEERLRSTSMSYSGVSGILLGEDFLKVLPLGKSSEPQINFSVPAGGTKTVTRYLVVGDADPGSVFDTGLKLLDISTHRISGVVKDSTGTPIADATVAVRNESDSTVIVYRTNANGEFFGDLSTGISKFDKAFGSGKYTLGVYKKGYGVKGSALSGSCEPEEIDVRFKGLEGIECTLGGSGVIKVSGGVTDADTGKKIPARVAVVGYLPAFRSETGGYYEDKVIFDRPLGIVDVFYINAAGTIGVEGRDSFRLAPGSYELVFTHGTEYSMEVVPIDIGGDVMLNIGPITLKKVVDTTGYISADFHLHSIASPDSAMRPDKRALAAAGEGMNVLQSSDHDYLVNYAPYVSELEKEGYIAAGSMVTITGQEISPNHIGHMNAFPLEYDASKPCGGALDWSFMSSDLMAGPQPDYVMSPQDIVNWARSLPGEHILQVNHIADLATSIFILGGWVTTPVYFKDFGVEPLSSYADPVLNRLMPKASQADYPYPFGSSEMVVTDVDTLELVIGPELHDNLLLTSTLPQWFNLLNLGLIYTATGDSDSHREIAVSVGTPRNFVISETDPADGLGSFSNFNVDKYVESIRDHKVMVSAGPFVKVFAKNASGDRVTMGDTIKGSHVTLEIDVVSPKWAWFDTVEIFANTEPLPADDEDLIPFEGKAKDPAEFFEPYHIPRFFYKPTYSYRLKDKTLENWEEGDDTIKSSIEVEMDLEKDTWIVVMVRGTEDTEGFRSIFPFVMRALVDADNPNAVPEDVPVGNVDMLRLTGAPAWAFTNPIFVDVDGDGFKSLYSDEWDLSTGSAAYSPPAEKEEDSSKKAIIPPRPRSATSANSELLKPF